MLPIVTVLSTPPPCVPTHSVWCNVDQRFQISRTLIVRDTDGKYYFQAWTDDGRRILIPLLLEIKK